MVNTLDNHDSDVQNPTEHQTDSREPAAAESTTGKTGTGQSTTDSSAGDASANAKSVRKSVPKQSAAKQSADKAVAPQAADPEPSTGVPVDPSTASSNDPKESTGDSLNPSNIVRKMLNMKDKSKELMTRSATNQLVTYRLKGARPEAWEEDISRNTLDAEPFHNLAAPAEREFEEFNNRHRMKSIGPLMDGRTLEQMVARDVYPIPCPPDREGYSPGRDELYWLSGLEDFLKVMQVVKKFGVYPRSVLDFGSASGRVVRHFAAQTEIPEIWGTDINQRHIRWLYEFMPPQVKPLFNHCIPSLPIRDNSVDVITAFSVFTHIDTFETCWLSELRRIMHDDGLCYLTVHNEDTWNICRKELDNPNNRLVQSILKIDPQVIDKIHEPLADTRTVYRFAEAGPYRAQVFHSNNYLHKVWGRFFTIEEILPMHHVRQTVVVLRKK